MFHNSFSRSNQSFKTGNSDCRLRQRVVLSTMGERTKPECEVCACVPVVPASKHRFHRHEFTDPRFSDCDPYEPARKPRCMLVETHLKRSHGFTSQTPSRAALHDDSKSYRFPERKKNKQTKQRTCLPHSAQTPGFRFVAEQHLQRVKLTPGCVWSLNWERCQRGISALCDTTMSRSAWFSTLSEMWSEQEKRRLESYLICGEFTDRTETHFTVRKRR